MAAGLQRTGGRSRPARVKKKRGGGEVKYVTSNPSQTPSAWGVCMYAAWLFFFFLELCTAFDPVRVRCRLIGTSGAPLNSCDPTGMWVPCGGVFGGKASGRAYIAAWDRSDEATYICTPGRAARRATQLRSRTRVGGVLGVRRSLNRLLLRYRVGIYLCKIKLMSWAEQVLLSAGQSLSDRTHAAQHS